MNPVLISKPCPCCGGVGGVLGEPGHLVLLCDRCRGKGKIVESISDQSRPSDELEKLRQFKAYVHARLDAAGIPVDPDSPHKAEGCRIGGRLDLVLSGWRADDAEPVTSEWLVRIGFSAPSQNTTRFHWAGTYQQCVGCSIGKRGKLEWVLNGNTIDRDRACIFIPKQSTRGHVRRLCKALGFELKEPA